MQAESGARESCRGFWTRADLVTRANRWARAYGYAEISEETFHEWQKDKLLGVAEERPGRGYGLGRERGRWSSMTYRRMLRLIAWGGADGLRLRRVLRVCLWLSGEEVDLLQVRCDLVMVYQHMAAALRRDLRIGGSVNRSLTPGQIRKLMPGWDASDLAKAVGEIGVQPSGFIPALREVVERTAPDGGLGRLAVTMAEAWFGSPVEAKGVSGALRDTPYRAAGELGADADLESMQNMLTDPREDENAVLSALHNATDADLLAVRNFILGLNELFASIFGGLRRFIELHPEQLGGFAIVRPQLLVLVGQLEHARLLQSPASRLLAFVVYLARAGRSPDGSQKLEQIAELRLGSLIDLLTRDGRLFAAGDQLTRDDPKVIISSSHASAARKEKWTRFLVDVPEQ